MLFISSRAGATRPAVMNSLQSKIDSLSRLESMLFRHVEKYTTLIDKIASRIVSHRRGTCYIAGNGGAMSSASHFVAELSGRYLYDDVYISAQALCSDPSLFTALGNDYQSFEDILLRETRAKMHQKDLFIGMTTTSSPNIIKAAKEIASRGMTTILFIGQTLDKDGYSIEDSILKEVNNGADLIVLPAYAPFDTATIQEFHLMMIHVICEQVDKALVNAKEENI